MRCEASHATSQRGMVYCIVSIRSKSKMEILQRLETNRANIMTDEYERKPLSSRKSLRENNNNKENGLHWKSLTNLRPKLLIPRKWSLSVSQTNEEEKRKRFINCEICECVYLWLSRSRRLTRLKCW